MQVILYGKNRDNSIYLTEHVRIASDMINLIFLFDDHTDELDASKTQAWVDIALDAMKNPATPRPEGEGFIGELFRQ